MRHRLRAAALSSLLLLAGCGNPGGVDGNLTDGWASIGTPTGFTPVARTCHLANYSPVGTRSAYEEVDCDLKHRTETVFVGEYPKCSERRTQRRDLLQLESTCTLTHGEQ